MTCHAVDRSVHLIATEMPLDQRNRTCSPKLCSDTRCALTPPTTKPLMQSYRVLHGKKKQSTPTCYQSQPHPENPPRLRYKHASAH